MRVESRPLPGASLHESYARSGAYTDCFTADVSGNVSLAHFVEAFYTSRVFKLERWILKWSVNKPSTDAEVSELAAGNRDRFAAWTVEGRTTDQLLMCDYMSHTRSWLMVTARSDEAGGTRLYFGSVVVPMRRFPYRVLIGFHRLYSRILLRSAVARLARTRKR